MTEPNTRERELVADAGFYRVDDNKNQVLNPYVLKLLADYRQEILERVAKLVLLRRPIGCSVRVHGGDAGTRMIEELTNLADEIRKLGEGK
jgi:hypothetical protein